LTVPDTDRKRIGTELKTRIQAAKGQKLVYFDFDSEEYVVFAMYGDANTQGGKMRCSCSSPTGFIAFGGSKENQSDPHWTLAKVASISRQIAKNVNYAVIYGGGMTTVTNTVHTGDRLMTRDAAAKVAISILEAKKGKKIVDPKNPDCLVTKFSGGCDSAAFNFMEALVMQPRPMTPMLNCIMPESLWWQNLPTPGTYKTNRINWTIQRSGADILAVMCTLVNYLFRKYGVAGHFMFSYHDQLLFSVDENRCYEAAYLLNIAHMWTWALMRFQLDIEDYVVTNLFPSTTTIDTIFRKEGTKSTLTSSQQKEEPLGEDLNFIQIMDKLSPEFLACIQGFET
jgi:DNA polymerase gamma 1